MVLRVSSTSYSQLLYTLVCNESRIVVLGTMHASTIFSNPGCQEIFCRPAVNITCDCIPIGPAVSSYLEVHGT